MSTGTVVKRERAKDDLLDYALYIAVDQPAAAARFLRAAEDAFAKLASMPEMGALYGFTDARFVDLRFWPLRGFENYLVFYRPLPDGIEVVRVLHGARDLERVLTR